MRFISRFGLAIAVALPLIILLTIRTCSTRTFKYDARKWASPSFDNSNVINEMSMGSLKGDKLIVDLDSSSDRIVDNSPSAIHISPDSILLKKHLNKIRDHKGPVLLFSSDPALSARLWMILSETGCNNLYILASSDSEEIFKSKFRPDTLVRPEL
jgi:hypothetical protein